MLTTILILLFGSGLLLGQPCPVTTAPNPSFVPPAPYPSKPGTGASWFGTGKLWTILPNDHRWSQGEKTFWWRGDWAHYQGIPPAEVGRRLSVTAQRIDAPAPAPAISNANGSYRPRDWKSFLVGGIEFPTPGCWEITGHYQDGELHFVILVVRRPR